MLHLPVKMTVAEEIKTDRETGAKKLESDTGYRLSILEGDDWVKRPFCRGTSFTYSENDAEIGGKTVKLESIFDYRLWRKSSATSSSVSCL